MNRLALPLLLFAAGCPSSDEVEWVRFNADDTFDVQITPGVDPGPSVQAVLTSTTGAVVVGSVTLDPGAAPAGTLHELWVHVGEAYKDSVGKVELSVDSGARGVETFSLERDSADHGAWWVELRSVGDATETRTDVFSVLLYVPLDAEVGVNDSGGGA